MCRSWISCFFDTMLGTFVSSFLPAGRRALVAPQTAVECAACAGGGKNAHGPMEAQDIADVFAGAFLADGGCPIVESPPPPPHGSVTEGVADAAADAAMHGRVPRLNPRRRGH